MTDAEDLYQIALLVDQMKHDDVQLRLNAFKNLERIAQALGADRTRDELIPFIADCIDDEDSVINVIAEKLGVLSNYVGSAENFYVLLKPLEYLVCGEESSIREKAIASADEIVQKMPEVQIVRHFCPLIYKLSNQDWFTSRSSAAALTPLVFHKVNDKLKSDMMSILVRLSSDSAAAVRRSVARSLPSIIRKSALSPNFTADILEIYKSLSKDEQDSIRIQVIIVGVALAETASWEYKSNTIVPTIITLAGDRSWRVRWSLCHHLKDIFPNVSTINPNQPNNTPSAADATISTSLLSNLANVYDNLLNDAEPEVRAAASIHLSLIGKYLPKAMLITRLLPSIQRLVGDNSDFVRAVISNEISQISPLLGKEDTIKHILPLLLTLLRDDASDVRLNVISHLDGIHLTLGVEQLSQSLLPAIIALAQDTKWRVRLAIIELMPIISKQLGADIFTEHLLSVNMEWLNDRVFSIRKVAAMNLRHISQLFGEEWTMKHILPNLEKLHQHTSYIQRMTSLYTVQVLLEGPHSAKTTTTTSSVTTVSSSSSTTKVGTSNHPYQQSSLLMDQKINMNIMKLLIHNILRLLNDNVANVRLTLAKTLSTAMQSLLASSTSYYDNTVYTTMINALNTLVSDGDRDVRFYAKEALEKNKSHK